MSEKVSDITFLKTFTSGKTEMMKMFINTFFQSADSSLKEINLHFENKNWLELKKAAHQLKPQLSYMGITRLAPIIQELENNAGEEKNLEQIPEQVKQINELTNQAIEELKVELQTL